MNSAQSRSSSDQSITLLHPGRGNGRRFALISKVLSSMGRMHNAVVPYFGTGSLGRLEQAALADPYCRKVRKAPPRPWFVIGTQDQIDSLTAEKKLTVSFDTKRFLSGKADEDTFFHPILFHPDLVSEDYYTQAGELAESHARDIGVLFAGNCDPKAYSFRGMRSEHGVLNRIEIEALAKRLPNGRIFVPQSADEFETARRQGGLKDKLVWIDTRRFRIPQAEWLAFIARSRFFLCTPGVQYPYCQNLNEAAACGSVPILQFPSAYHPSLKDDEDALAFGGEEEFEPVISRALGMPPDEWEQLSSGAATYHAKHLSLLSLQKRLQTFLDDPKLDRMTWVMAGKQK